MNDFCVETGKRLGNKENVCIQAHSNRSVDCVNELSHFRNHSSNERQR